MYDNVCVCVCNLDWPNLLGILLCDFESCNEKTKLRK